VESPLKTNANWGTIPLKVASSGDPTPSNIQDQPQKFVNVSLWLRVPFATFSDLHTLQVKQFQNKLS
jgi:hypothetical protein